MEKEQPLDTTDMTAEAIVMGATRYLPVAIEELKAERARRSTENEALMRRESVRVPGTTLFTVDV